MATILVVDDSAVNRELLATLIAARGHRLLEARDGREALARARAERPDLVLCDLLMPTMDGYEFVRQLRADPAVAATRVIYCTAHYHAREARALAQEAGVTDVLVKPIEPDALLRALDAALGDGPAPAPPAPAAEFDRVHLQLVTDKVAATVNELQLANERLRALIDLNVQLIARRDPLELVARMCEGARDLFGARRALACVRERDAGEPVRHFASGFAPEVAAQLAPAAPDRGLFRAVVGARRTLRLASARGRRIAGLPAAHPPVRSLLAAPIASYTAVHGWLCLTDRLGADEFSADEERLLVALGELAGRAYENGSLHQRLQRESAERLRALSRRLVEVQESERRRLSRELHDRVGQNLTALGINLDILRGELTPDACAGLRPRLDDSIALVESTAAAIDDVLAELRPPLLEEHGLLPALQWYARQFAQRTDIEVAVRGAAPARRPLREIEFTLFRIVQEALNNVAKHARARRVELTFADTPSEWQLTVADDGVGFDPQSVRAGGRGMASMRERAQLIGGRLDVAAAPGAGARLTIRAPLAP